jgi:hypothetical protein
MTKLFYMSVFGTVGMLTTTVPYFDEMSVWAFINGLIGIVGGCNMGLQLSKE